MSSLPYYIHSLYSVFLPPSAPFVQEKAVPQKLPNRGRVFAGQPSPFVLRVRWCRIFSAVFSFSPGIFLNFSNRWYTLPASAHTLSGNLLQPFFRLQTPYSRNRLSALNNYCGCCCRSHWSCFCCCFLRNLCKNPCSCPCNCPCRYSGICSVTYSGCCSENCFCSRLHCSCFCLPCSLPPNFNDYTVSMAFEMLLYAEKTSIFFRK